MHSKAVFFTTKSFLLHKPCLAILKSQFSISKKLSIRTNLSVLPYKATLFCN